MMAPEVLLTVYLVRDLHLPAWLSGVLFTLNTVLVVACQLAVSRAAGRLRPVAVLRLAAGGWAVPDDERAGGRLGPGRTARPLPRRLPALLGGRAAAPGALTWLLAAGPGWPLRHSLSARQADYPSPQQL